MTDSFTRARSPEQKTIRQIQILEAARDAINNTGLDHVRMSDLARQAGMAPSALYRYFKSKEEILAHLLILEADELTDEFNELLPNCKSFNDVAACFASTFAGRPLFCRLASDLSSTIERNVAVERLVFVKQEFMRVLGEWSAALMASAIFSTQISCIKFIRAAYVLHAGLWPMTQDRPNVQAAIRQASAEYTFGNYEIEYRDALIVLALGLKAISSSL